MIRNFIFSKRKLIFSRRKLIFSRRKLIFSRRKLILVRGNWISVSWNWFSVGGNWFSVGGNWFSVRGNWFSVGGNWFSVGGNWFSVRGNWISFWGNWFSLGGNRPANGIIDKILPSNFFCIPTNNLNHYIYIFKKHSNNVNVVHIHHEVFVFYETKVVSRDSKCKQTVSTKLIIQWRHCYTLLCVFFINKQCK